MALLTSSFMRAHPVKSGMMWVAPLALGTLVGNWLFGRLNLPFVATLLLLSLLGALAWGYAMKAYYNRVEGGK